MNYSKIIGFFGILGCFTLNAETFDFSIDVSKQNSVLVAEQIKSMSFPPIVVDTSSREGDFCSIEFPFSSHPAQNELCRSTEDGKEYAHIKVTGSPYSTVQVSYEYSGRIENGFTADIFKRGGWDQGHQFSFNESGTESFELWARLRLTSISEVSPGTSTLSYNVIVNYI